MDEDSCSDDSLKHDSKLQSNCSFACDNSDPLGCINIKNEPAWELGNTSPTSVPPKNQRSTRGAAQQFKIKSECSDTEDELTLSTLNDKIKNEAVSYPSADDTTTTDSERFRTESISPGKECSNKQQIQRLTCRTAKSKKKNSQGKTKIRLIKTRSQSRNHLTLEITEKSDEDQEASINESSIEETEARRMRMRINNIKARFLTRLRLTDAELKEKRLREAQRLRERRAQRRKNETAEQLAERKLYDAQQKAWMRNCKEAAETPEETATRKAKECADARKYRAQRIAKENTEQREARKERERLYRIAYKQRKQHENAANAVTAEKPNDEMAAAAVECATPAVLAARKIIKYAHETEEEREQRKERQRQYREIAKQRRLEGIGTKTSS